MRLVLILILLAGCNTPGPHFRGIPATTVVIDGSTFDVRIRDSLGEAIRTNVEYAPRLGPSAERAKAAIEQVSGCRVQKLQGDQAHATGQLDCGQAPEPLSPSVGRQDAECLVTDRFRRPSTKEDVVELDCQVIR